MVVGMTMASTATSKYSLKQYLLPDSQSRIVKRNANLSIVTEGKLDDAYKQIEKELDIPVLVLSDAPSELQFKKLFLGDEQAILEFSYNGKSVYFEQAKMLDTGGKTEVHISDRKPCEEVYNFWLDKTVQIEENVLQDNLSEYSAQIKLDKSYYYLSGIMEKEQFIRLVEEIIKY